MLVILGIPIALAVLVYMDIIYATTAWIIIGIIILLLLTTRVRGAIKVIFFGIILAVLVFTGILHAGIALLLGLLIINNCCFYTKTHHQYTNFTNMDFETALKDGTISAMHGDVLASTPLVEIRDEDPEGVAELLNADPDIYARAHVGNTPLHHACYFNKSFEVIQTLLNAGADVKARNFLGDTPLHSAVEGSENPEVIQLLLDAGADIHATNELAETPFYCAQENEALKGTDAYQALKDASE